MRQALLQSKKLFSNTLPDSRWQYPTVIFTTEQEHCRMCYSPPDATAERERQTKWACAPQWIGE